MTVRMLGRSEHPLTVVMAFPVVAGPLALPFALPVWVWPNLVETAAMVGAAVAAAGGQYLLTVGLKSAHAAPEGVFIARERHVQALRRVDAHLLSATAHLSTASPTLDLLAEELRLAQTALNEITGEFTSDDLLGVIFSSFCIGK